VTTELREIGVGSPGFAAWEELLREGFPVDAKRSFFDDFQVWRHNSPLIKRLGIFLGETLISAGGVRIAEMQLSLGRFEKVALIGGMVTHAAHQRQGHSKRVLEALEQSARDEAASCVCLWAGEAEPMYLSVGYRHCGVQGIYPVGSMSLKQPVAQINVKEGWDPHIFDALLKRERGLRITEQDRNWIESQKSVHWYWCEDGGVFRAFVAEGKGIDLVQMIHEWGGSMPHVRGLIAELARRQPTLSVLSRNDWLEAEHGVSTAEMKIPMALVRGLKADFSFESFARAGWFWGLDSC
jgi:GNAT superfamily N-acetyltransferase